MSAGLMVLVIGRLTKGTDEFARNTRKTEGFARLTKGEEVVGDAAPPRIPA